MADPGGVAIAREGVKWYWRAIAWLYRQTFRVGPPGWAATTVGSGALAVVGATQLLPGVDGMIATGAPGGVAIAGTAALLAWSRMARKTNRVVMFVSPFQETSAGDAWVAALQVDALRREITEDPLLAERVELRSLRAPLDAPGGARVLTWTDGHLCVSGDVVTAGGRSRWAPRLALRWTWSTGVSGRRGVRLSRPKLHPATTADMAVDVGVPIVVFAEEDFSSGHARGIRAALMVLVAGENPDGDPRTAAMCRDAATRDAGALPPLLRALLVILEANAVDATSLGDWFKRRARLMAAGAESAGLDHPYLWMEVTSAFTLAERADETQPSQRLPYARRALEAAPTEPLASFGLGTALVATAEERLIYHGDVEGAKRLCAEAVPHLREAERAKDKDVRREVQEFLRAAEAGVRDPVPVFS